MALPLKEKDELLTRELLEYRDDLFSFILSMVRNWTLAEDIFQETSLVIIRKQEAGVEIDNFRAWAREIARRTALNHWKTSKRRERLLSSDSMDIIENAFRRQEEAPNSETLELIEHLRVCLTKLPQHLFRMIRLRYRDNLSYKEIGKCLRRSAGSVQVAVYRTHARLLECIKKACARKQGQVS